MTHDVTMPQLGMTQDSGIILSWNKSLGDEIAVGDVLMEVETDKATVEVEATEAGFLVEIRADAGSDIPVGDTVAVISENADDVSVESVAEIASSSQEPKASERYSPETKIVDNPPKTVSTIPPVEIGAQQVDGNILASPKAKVEAKERILDLSELVDQGIRQPIHFKDVVDYRPIALSSTVSAASQMNEITFTVLRSNVTDFIDHLNQQSGKDITVGHLWRMFVSGALRAVQSSEQHVDLYCRFAAAGMDPFTSMNADHVLLSAQNAVDDAGENADQLDVCIYDYSTTSISDLKLSNSAAHIALYITSKNKKTLNIKVASSEHVLPADQMLHFIDELNARLNNPLGFIA